MKLKLSDWASFAEILSGIAVVVTLILLILGIRENSEITRVSAYTSLVNGLNEIQRDVYKDPELNDMFWEMYSGNFDAATESETRIFRLRSLLTALFREYDTAFFSKDYGVLSNQEWERFETNICNFREFALDALGVDFANTLAVSSAFREHIASHCLNEHD